MDRARQGPSPSRTVAPNWHGLLGLLAILGTIGVAYLLNWRVSWPSLATVLLFYTAAVLRLSLLLNQSEETVQAGVRVAALLLWGFHCWLILYWAALPIQDAGLHVGLALLSLPVGLAIPFLLAVPNRKSYSVNTHGVAGPPLLILITIVLISGVDHLAVEDWLYYGAALLCYSVFNLGILVFRGLTVDDETFSPQLARVIWSAHTSLLFLAGGLYILLNYIEVIDLPSLALRVAVFIAASLSGFAIPFLLIRVYD